MAAVKQLRFLVLMESPSHIILISAAGWRHHPLSKYLRGDYTPSLTSPGDKDAAETCMAPSLCNAPGL